MDEKSPTNDKTRIKRASKQVYHLNGSKSPKIPVKSSSPSFSEGATFATTGAFVDDLTTNNLKMCLNYLNVEIKEESKAYFFLGLVCGFFGSGFGFGSGFSFSSTAGFGFDSGFGFSAGAGAGLEKAYDGK